MLNTQRFSRQNVVLFLFASALFLVAGFWSINYFKDSSPLHSVEVGIATLSDTDPNGGFAVPASCPAFSHTPGECDPSVSLTVNNVDSVNVNAGDPLTFRWTNNPNTYGCTAEGAWNGAKTPATTGTGQEVTTAPAGGGALTYTLRCRGASLAEALNYLNSNPTNYADSGTPAINIVSPTEAALFLNRAYTAPYTIVAADVSVGTDNIPRIAFFEFNSTKIKLYTCANANCSGTGTYTEMGIVDEHRVDFNAQTFGSTLYSPILDLRLLPGNIPEVKLSYASIEGDGINAFFFRYTTTCVDASCSSYTDSYVNNRLYPDFYPAGNPPVYSAAPDWFWYFLTQNDGITYINPANINLSTTNFDPFSSNPVFDVTSQTTKIMIGTYALRPNGQRVVLLPDSVGSGEGMFEGGQSTQVHFAYEPTAHIPGLRFACENESCPQQVIRAIQDPWTPAEVTDSVTVNVTVIPPPPPVLPVGSCPVPGTSGTISWQPGVGSNHTRFHVLVDDLSNGWAGCATPNTGDSCTNVTGTSHSFTTVSGRTYNWSVAACNGGGCSSYTGLPGANDLICPYPTLTASCSVNPATQIVGQPVLWSATATGGTGTYTYSWTGSESLSGVGRTINKTYTTTGSKTGSVTVTSGTGAFAQSRTAACSNAVNVTGQPDLTTVLEPTSSSLVLGTSMTLSGRVRNLAPAAAVAPASNARFQVKPVAASTWTNVGGLVPTGALNIGAGSGVITAPAASPSIWTPTALGSYHVQFCADVDVPDDVDELDETNNCSATRTVTVTGRPDLFALIDTVSNVTEGTSMTFVGRVRNAITAPVNAPASTARFQIDMNDNGVWTDAVDIQNQGTHSIGVLAPNTGSGSISSNAWTATTGRHRVRLCADTANVVDESDENNNCSPAQIFTVNATPITVTCTPSRTTINVGEDVVWHATVTGVSNPWLLWALPGANTDCDSPFSFNNFDNTCTYRSGTGGSTQTMSVRFFGSSQTYSCGNVQINSEAGPSTLTAQCTASLLSGNRVRWRAERSGGTGGPYTYSWTFTSGNPGSARTLIRTYVPNQTITGTITVSDGITARTDSCTATIPPPPPVCGNNVREGLEECDGTDTTGGRTCTASCTFAAICEIPNAICEPLKGETPLNCVDCKKDVQEQ